MRIRLILLFLFLASSSLNTIDQSDYDWHDLWEIFTTPGKRIEPQQSQTGPTPPWAVIKHDSLKQADAIEDINSEVVLTVPAYLWRHGCGPTAVGMVVGFYDLNGYDDLISGSANIQTEAVNQAIASGGEDGSPYPPGLEQHFEDFALPIDEPPDMLSDDYITQSRNPHADNSLADFMDTSKSTEGNYYGWSWASDIGPAFVAYVSHQNSSYSPAYQAYTYSGGTFNWNVLTTEIDAGRPMVFLVDSDGNGGTDHFVTVIGYRTSPTQQYASWDTWYSDVIRWENFAQMENGVPWGIWGGWSFEMDIPPEMCYPDYNLSCGSTDTWNNGGSGSTNNIDTYSCVNWNETGPEYAYNFSSNTSVEVTVSLGNLSADLDVFVLDDSSGDCQAGNCIAYGDDELVFNAIAGENYYVLVDGYNGAESDYTIDVQCKETLKLFVPFLWQDR